MTSLRWTPLALAALALGCGEGPTRPADPLDVEVAGRLERGETVRVRVSRAGSELPTAGVTLTFLPQGAAERLGGDSVRLLRAGTLRVQAADGAATTAREVEVARPPTVVFDRVVDGNRDLWSAALDGGELARLTDDPAEDGDGTVARGRIVFVSYRADRNAELFAMPATGGAAVRLTRTTWNEAAPALSGDGERLAFVCDASGLPRLWIAAGDGTRAAAAPGTGNSVVDASPTWAPDASRVVFMSTALGTADLLSSPLTRAPELLLGGAAAEVEPAFSPDGGRVAFASDRGTGTDIFVLRIATGELTRLTGSAASEGQPAWTSDGRLVYAELLPGGAQLRWIDPAQPGVSHPIPTGAGSAYNPAVVP